MNCNYCNNFFTTQRSLNNHQKNAQYCIKIQDELMKHDKNNENENDDCKYCNKKFFRKYELLRHLQNCKNKILLDLENLEKENKLLKEKIEQEEKEKLIEENKKLKEENKILKDEKLEITKLAIQKPTKVVKTYNTDNSKRINNTNIKYLTASLSDLSKNDIQKIFRNHFHEKHLLDGIKGFANFVLQSILITPDGRLRYICTDKSRNYFAYIDENGTIQTDIDCSHLLELVHEPAKTATKTLSKELEYKVESMETELKEEVDCGNIKKTDKGYKDSVELLKLEKKRSDFAFNRSLEIGEFDNKHKRQFVKNLINPLSDPNKTLTKYNKD